MSPQLVFVAVLLLIMQLFVPKKWAFVPILIAACHTSNVSVVGDFTTIRIVILAGLLRAFFKNNLNFSLQNFFDRALLLFCLFILISAVGHDPKWGKSPLKKDAQQGFSNKKMAQNIHDGSKLKKKIMQNHDFL